MDNGSNHPLSCIIDNTIRSTHRQASREMKIADIKQIDIILSYFDGLMQDFSNSIANTLELLQSCSKPLIYSD